MLGEAYFVWMKDGSISKVSCVVGEAGCGPGGDSVDEPGSRSGGESGDKFGDELGDEFGCELIDKLGGELGVAVRVNVSLQYHFRHNAYWHSRQS